MHVFYGMEFIWFLRKNEYAGDDKKEPKNPNQLKKQYYKKTHICIYHNLCI